MPVVPLLSSNSDGCQSRCPAPAGGGAGRGGRWATRIRDSSGAAAAMVRCRAARNARELSNPFRLDFIVDIDQKLLVNVTPTKSSTAATNPRATQIEFSFQLRTIIKSWVCQWSHVTFQVQVIRFVGNLNFFVSKPARQLRYQCPSDWHGPSHPLHLCCAPASGAGGTGTRAGRGQHAP